MIISPVNSTTLIGLAQYANTITDGWFWIAIIMVLWIIAIIFLKMDDLAESIIASSFVMAVLTTLLYLTEPSNPLIPQKLIWFFVIMTGVSVLYYRMIHR
jgi:hypothetical protein